MRSLIAVFVVLILFSGCEKKSEYKLRVEQELSSGEINDSLFLGFYFDMEKPVFFEHAWNLNKQTEIVNGEGAQMIRYLETPKGRLKQIFYPDFKDDKISAMPVEYQYMGWAPWNQHLFADSLIITLKKEMEGEYGTDFEEKLNPETGEPYFLSIEGNREIKIYKKDDSKAVVLFTDLSQIDLNKID
ncbi:MAG TPA: hypothetical protein DEQ34_05085 [Balneolaceae bacterium]|nr:hypothetical protein [Balneolaceae bacterium]|tara:strand:+ start:2803 stop:3363 length:561 start_codon:yes stop_codon:yes gene_type:complete